MTNLDFANVQVGVVMSMFCLFRRTMFAEMTGMLLCLGSHYFID